MKFHIGWIDFLKGSAILAVILDHLYNVVYTSHELHLFTSFSVTLFIFLAGITSVISIERNKKTLAEYQLRRMKGVLVPYAIATIIYGIVNLNYRFDWGNFWSDLILFKATPPFYFVLFYCQLALVAPFLYKLLIKKNLMFQIISLVPIYFVSKYLTHYTEVGGIYGGGGRILGGSYLFVFYLGMLFFLIYQKYSVKVNRLWIHLIGLLASITLIYWINISGTLSLAWSNPPNKQTILYSLSVFLLGYCIFMILAKWKVTKIFTSVFMHLGVHSYYIYLYHILAIHYASKNYYKFGISDNWTIKAIWFLSFAVAIPLLIGVVIKYRPWKWAYERISKLGIPKPNDGLDI